MLFARISVIFLFSYPVRVGQFKNVLGYFFALLTKISSKIIYHATKTYNFEFDLFDLVTLDDLDFTQGHKSLRKMLRSIPDTIHVVKSALFQFDTVDLPGGASYRASEQ